MENSPRTGYQSFILSSFDMATLGHVLYTEMNWAVGGGLRMFLSHFLQLLPKPFGSETLCVSLTLTTKHQPNQLSPHTHTNSTPQAPSPSPSLWRAKPYIARAYIDWLLLPRTSTVEHLILRRARWQSFIWKKESTRYILSSELWS